MNGDAWVLALLDTGADEVLLGLSVASEIGIDFDPLMRWQVGGFGGQSYEAVLGRVDVEVTDDLELLRLSIAVGIVDYGNPALEDTVILGHSGFLEFFDADFHGADRFVELLPNSDFLGQVTRLKRAT